MSPKRRRWIAGIASVALLVGLLTPAGAHGCVPLGTDDTGEAASAPTGHSHHSAPAPSGSDSEPEQHDVECCCIGECSPAPASPRPAHEVDAGISVEIVANIPTANERIGPPLPRYFLPVAPAPPASPVISS